MAETIVITETDRIEAENIMEQYLSDNLPDVDFSKGSAVRDLVIGSLAYIFAYLKKERDLVRARQSLLLLGALTGTDVDDAVDEILSNWFIRRRDGQFATGTATVYLTRSTSVTVPTTARFYKSATIQYVINSDIDLAYSEDDLLPLADSSGEIVAYALNVPLIAISQGEEYNVAPGSFSDFTRFSAYISRIENTAYFSGGGGIETTTDMLDRAETAISVRDLNSARSIDVTLKDLYPNVEDVTVIGYGDPEMQRDLITEGATSTRIHVGGHVDAYLKMPLTVSKTYTAEIGGTFTDTREHYYILRDDTVADFSTISKGDVISMYNNAPTSEANMYFVKSSTPYGIEVSSKSPFPGAVPVVESSFDDGVVTAAGDQLETTSHNFGKVLITYDDGEVEDVSAQFISLIYTFTADDVGKWVRIKNSSLGNNGTYKIVALVTENRVEVRNLEVAPPVFVSETNLEWDLLEATDLGKWISIKNSKAEAALPMKTAST